MKLMNLLIALFMIVVPFAIIIDYIGMALSLPLLEAAALWMTVGHLLSLSKPPPRIDLSIVDLPGMLGRLQWTAMWPYRVRGK